MKKKKFKNLFKSWTYKYIIMSAKRTERQRIIDALKEDKETYSCGIKGTAIREYIEELIQWLEEQ